MIVNASDNMMDRFRKFGIFCLLFVLFLCLTACSGPAVTDDESTDFPMTAVQTADAVKTEAYETEETTAAFSESLPETDALTTAPMPQITIPPETESIPTEAIAADPAVYFENNLFVGDSILEGVAQYVRAQRQSGNNLLSDAKFLTSIMGIRVADLVGDTADYERICYQYRGAVRELTEIIAMAEPKRLFLLVGMNDLAGGATVEDTIARYERLLELLQQSFPTLELVVMTPTPKTASTWLPNYCTNPEFGSPLLREFSDRLMALCEDMSVPCVDIFAALADESGNLPDNFSRDNYVHINDLGSAVVADTLNRFAEEGPLS